MARDTLLPHVAPGNHSPLQDLMRSAMRRFGDFGAARVEGELSLLLTDMANQVIEDLAMHPYWSGGVLDYYTHPTETRPIPDLIMVYGLCAYYAFQQGSEKAAPFQQVYQRNTNQILYKLMAGGNPRVELRPPELADGRRLEEKVRSGQ